MDFNHYMGKGVHQQGDASSHFKDSTSVLGMIASGIQRELLDLAQLCFP